MMILIFRYAVQYLPPHGTKDTTRRVWKPRTLAAWQKAWDTGNLTHVAVDWYLTHGGGKIGTITLLERPFVQRLSEMPHDDLIREGGMVPSVEEFIAKYFKGNSDLEVAVIRFAFKDDRDPFYCKPIEGFN